MASSSFYTPEYFLLPDFLPTPVLSIQNSSSFSLSCSQNWTFIVHMCSIYIFHTVCFLPKVLTDYSFSVLWLILTFLQHKYCQVCRRHHSNHQCHCSGWWSCRTSSHWGGPEETPLVMSSLWTPLTLPMDWFTSCPLGGASGASGQNQLLPPWLQVSPSYPPITGPVLICTTYSLNLFCLHLKVYCNRYIKVYKDIM